MSESPYAIPVEELVDSARVPEAEQVETRTEYRLPDSDWSDGLNPYGDGMCGDADGG